MAAAAAPPPTGPLSVDHPKALAEALAWRPQLGAAEDAACLLLPAAACAGEACRPAAAAGEDRRLAPAAAAAAVTGSLLSYLPARRAQACTPQRRRPRCSRSMQQAWRFFMPC